MHRERLHHLFGMAACGIDHAQTGEEGDMLALRPHQLGHCVLHRTRLAKNLPVTDTHLIRPDDQPVIMTLGNGHRLGLCQTANQGFCRFSGNGGFIHLWRGALERQAEFFQQRLAIA